MQDICMLHATQSCFLVAPTLAPNTVSFVSGGVTYDGYYEVRNTRIAWQ